MLAYRLLVRTRGAAMFPHRLPLLRPQRCYPATRSPDAAPHPRTHTDHNERPDMLDWIRPLPEPRRHTRNHTRQRIISFKSHMGKSLSRTRTGVSDSVTHTKGRGITVGRFDRDQRIEHAIPFTQIEFSESMPTTRRHRRGERRFSLSENTTREIGQRGLPTPGRRRRAQTLPTPPSRTTPTEKHTRWDPKPTQSRTAAPKTKPIPHPERSASASPACLPPADIQHKRRRVPRSGRRDHLTALHRRGDHLIRTTVGQQCTRQTKRQETLIRPRPIPPPLLATNR